MATTPTIVVGRNNWGIKNGNLLGYYQSDDGFFVKREFAATRGGGTNGTFVGSNGLIQTAASGNLPRIDFTGGSPALLVEPAATNSIRNNTMVGAVAGTPGTLPTNYVEQLSGGFSRQVVGTGTENGVSYVDIRISGTQSNSTPTDIRFESATQIAASNTQNWTESVYLKIVAAPNPPTDYRLYMLERTSGGVFVTSANQAVLVTTTLTRFSFSRALNGGATVAAIQPAIFFTTSNGSTYDFTIRIGLPQMELGSVATSVIPTTTSGLTRNADVINLTGATDYIGQTEGTIYWEGAINRYDRVFFALASGSSTTQCVRLQTTGAGTMQFIVVSGTIQANIATSGAITLGQFYKAAVAYKENDFVFFLNGAQVGVTDTSGTLPTNLNSVYLLNSNGTEITDQQCRTAAVYNKRLSNQELIEITS